MDFKTVVEAVFMPQMSLFGIIGNCISMCVLHNKNVKLRKDFVDVLCSLATFDILFLVCTFFLFSLPMWSSSYERTLYPILAPFLFPMTNTFMTASIYMTVAVAVNRYMEMAVNLVVPCRIMSGAKQAVIVFVTATFFNLPRWFEFQYKYDIQIVNETLANGSIGTRNVTYLDVYPTDLRENEWYVRYYTLIANTLCVLLIPTTIMLISTFLIVKQMIMPSARIYTNEQEKARKKRNRSITLMLIGIIVLFVVCHIGEVVVSLYEMILYMKTGKNTTAFPLWARNLIVVNHFLIVTNSSLNFVIYCKDLVFRQTVKSLYTRVWKKKPSVRNFRSRQFPHHAKSLNAVTCDQDASASKEQPPNGNSIAAAEPFLAANGQENSSGSAVAGCGAVQVENIPQEAENET